MKIAEKICEQKLESSFIKYLSEKLINSVLFGSGQWTSPNLIMPSLFNSVASRGRDISTCVESGVTHRKHWFWVKLALISFRSTFTTAVDNSTMCTNRLLLFCGILSCFSRCCVTLGERFILQGKVATLISWGGLSLYCYVDIPPYLTYVATLPRETRMANEPTKFIVFQKTKPEADAFLS